VLSLLPEIMPSYGKLRIVDSDCIRSASASGDGSQPERDMSFTRVIRLQYEIQTRQLCYGQLERVLVCDLPKNSTLGPLSGKKRLLAVIFPCQNTRGKDAALEITTHRGIGPVTVVDLQCVVAVVGRIQTRGSWKLIGRTDALIRPEFVQEIGEDDEGAIN
ncbi:hypothetical protein C8F04DRAFT_942392, partial [Mycena alexandri]